MVKTKLQQVHIRNLQDAGPMFNKRNKDGSTPLVLVPRERLMCSSYIKIPSDAHVVMQRWGRDIDPLEPGFHWLPPWYRVAYLVTKQSNTYNAPVHGCPTLDNVKVKVDLTLVFSIIHPRDFVYKIGATRFDDLLQAASEEAIRNLVRATEISKVYELRGSRADLMLSSLNEKFADFGVRFSNATITNVEMPARLAESLQAATTYESKLEEQLKHHDFRMQELTNRAAKERKDVDNTNEMLMKELVAKRDRAVINAEKAVIEANRKHEVAIVEANKRSEVELINAEAGMYNAKSNADKDRITNAQEAESSAEARRIAAEQRARTLKVESDKELRVRTDQAKGKEEMAEAEAKAAELFREMRAHELEMNKLLVLGTMARQGRVMISGEQGDALIQEIMRAASVGVDENK